MKNKKIIIIISLMLIFGLIMILIFSGNKKSNNNNENNNENKENINNSSSNQEKISIKYIVIDNDSNWLYNGNFEKTTSTAIKNAKTHFKIYADNNYIGEYKLIRDKKWNVFDDEDNFIPYKGNLFAFSSDFDIRLIRIITANITDSDKEFITSGYENKTFDYLITNDVVNIDLDDNGQIDKVVALSNSNEEIDNNYNLVYIILNDKLYTLVNETVKDFYSSSIYNINRIFTFNNEKYILIKETKNYIGDNVKVINHMFKYDNDNFIEIIHD